MNINWLVAPTIAVALVLFAVGEQSVRRCRAPKERLACLSLCALLGIPGFLFPLYYLHWFDEALWFYRFRSLPYTELTAAGAGLLAGGLSELIKGKKLASRPFLIAMLCLGICAPHVKPILAPVPSRQFVDRWEGDVCLQTTQSSCGAASAATIFRSLGESVSEREVAEECFTYLGGTENWYIARAFGRRGYTVTYRIGHGLPEDLRTPAIAGVRIGGMGHFIAIVDRRNGMYVTGDPLVGREETPLADMERKFSFTGFFMEIARKGNRAPTQREETVNSKHPSTPSALASEAEKKPQPAPCCGITSAGTGESGEHRTRG